MNTQAEFLRATYPVTMTEQAKTQWLRDLRNPENKQARQTLCDKLTGRCCLGILNDVQKVPTKPHGVSGTILSYIYEDGYDSIGIVPDFFSGMTVAMSEHLASMNDQQYKTFKQIAKFIEAHIFPSYPGLRILNHYPDQYYVYTFEGSQYVKGKRFDKNTILGNRYTACRYPNELAALFNRRTLKAFLRHYCLNPPP